jgi:hypothetical protein
VTRFLPAEITQLLHRHGFGELADFGPEQARAAYFQGRTDIDIAGAQRLIAATLMPALLLTPGSTAPWPEPAAHYRCLKLGAGPEHVAGTRPTLARERDAQNQLICAQPSMHPARLPGAQSRQGGACVLALEG